MLVIGNALPMLVPMDQSLGELRPLRVVTGGIVRVLKMPKGMRSQPQPLRHHCSGEEEKSGGESLARRTPGLCRIQSHRVKRRGRAVAERSRPVLL